MSDPGYSTDEDIDHGSSSISKILDAVLTPFRALVSKQAQKAYLGTLLFICTSLFMICVSTVAYWVFYYKFIPQVGLERIVHLQFGDGHPWGASSVGSQLVSLQPYDVTVKLELPRTPSNLAAGNFMLDLTLFSHPSTSVLTGANTSVAPIAHSRRPAILTYTSSMVDTASRLSLMPLYVTGWNREAETLEIQMLEKFEFPRGWRNLPETLRLEIQSHERMQVYNAKVEFRARFTGLRWIMYNWRLSSFIVFSCMFWSASMVSTVIIWIAMAALFSTSGGGHEIWAKNEPRDRIPIKEESDEETPRGLASFSTDESRAARAERINRTLIKEESEEESPRGLASYSNDETRTVSKRIKEEHDPEEAKRLDILTHTDDETEETEETRGEGSGRDSGAGTGLESAEAQGIQRRRSHLIQEDS